MQQQLRAKYRSKDKEVKKNLKYDKRVWLNSLINDAQHAADMGNMKTPESWAKVEEWKQLKGKAENAKSKRMQQQLRAKYRSKDKEVKKNLKYDKRVWLNSLINDAQHAADMGNMKTLYGITKYAMREPTRIITAINDKGGKTITDDSSGLARWKEQFEEILNRPPRTNPIVTTADEVPEIEEIRTRPVSKGEVKNAKSSLKNGKAAGVDNIVAELLKAGIKTTTQKLHEVFQMIWENEVMPHEWLKGLIVTQTKKVNLKENTNWRVNTLPFRASKVLGKILMERLKRGVNKRLRAEQARFRQGRSNTEQIFILRKIIEQSYKWQTPLVINFIDLRKPLTHCTDPASRTSWRRKISQRRSYG